MQCCAPFVEHLSARVAAGRSLLPDEVACSFAFWTGVSRTLLAVSRQLNSCLLMLLPMLAPACIGNEVAQARRGCAGPGRGTPFLRFLSHVRYPSHLEMRCEVLQTRRQQGRSGAGTGKPTLMGQEAFLEKYTFQVFSRAEHKHHLLPARLTFGQLDRQALTTSEPI